MKLPLATRNDLLHYFDRADIIRQTAEQLTRDMEQFGETIVYSGNPATAYEELFKQTEPFIQKLIFQRYEKLLQLLYRIDVNEKFIAEVVSSGKDVSAGITHLILYRELQKVVIRNYYSANKSG